MGGEAAFLAGLIFMLYPTFQGQLGAAHTGLLVLWGMPLLMLALLRVHEGRRFIALGALMFAVAVGGSTLLLIYLVAPIIGVYLLVLLHRREWGRLRRTAITLLLGSLCAAPFVVPILREMAGGASETSVVRYSAALLAIVSPSFYHPLFSGLDYPHRVLGVDPFEWTAYLGIVAAALGLLGLARRREARWWLIVALGAWVFSLGSLLKLYDAPLTVRIGGYATTIPLPGAILQYLPVLRGTRTPGRFNFAVGFAVAVMAGYGAAVLARWLKPPLVRRSILIGIAVLIVGEYQVFFPLPTVDAALPEAIYQLANRTDIRSVFDVPFEHPLVDKEALYLQIAHQQALIAGHIARNSPLDRAEAWLLQTFDPALLDAVGVDIVILHHGREEPEFDAIIRERLGAPLYEDERYAVFEVPPYTGAPPDFTWFSRVDENVITSGAIYLYAPAPGMVTLRGHIDADGRGAALTLDGVPLVNWTVSSEQGWNLPITLSGAGFHTLTLSAVPACPPPNDPTLVCRPLRVTQLELTDYRPLTSP